MPHFWLVRKSIDAIEVFVQPGASLVEARMKAAVAGFEEFTDAVQLDSQTAMMIPKNMIGRILVGDEAEGLLQKFAEPVWTNLSE